MIFINALKIIELALEHDVLREKEGYVLVYRSASKQTKEGWCLMDKDTLAQELMNDKKGQKALLNALKEKNIEFLPIELSI